MTLQKRGKHRREREKLERKTSEHLSVSFSSYTAQDEASLERLISANGKTLSCSSKHGAQIEPGRDGQRDRTSLNERDGATYRLEMEDKIGER